MTAPNTASRTAPRTDPRTDPRVGRRTRATWTARPGRLLGVVVAAMLVLAACGGDEAEPATTSTASPAAADPTTASAAADPASPAATDGAATDAAAGAVTVEVAATDLGDVLVDGAGLTLYVFDNDGQDTSACTEGCLDTWPPLLASDVTAGDGVTAELNTFTRADGDQQVTVGGLPLYFYAADTAPGDVAGQGVGDVWWVVDPAGEKVTATANGAAAPDDAGDATGDATDGGTPAY